MGFKLSKLQVKEEALWVNQYGEEVSEGNPDNLELLIAPMGTKAYRHESYRAARRRGGGTEAEQAESALIRAIVRHVLLDWRNLQDADGNDIPYSRDTAAQLLTETPDFLDLVCSIAADRRLFGIEAVEEDAKN